MEQVVDLAVEVDGVLITQSVRPRLLLSDFLRNTAGATSVHLA
jgi:aerobic-type carbon monoxide dehydrogenase small subunit (CoxS/CutS family)